MPDRPCGSIAALGLPTTTHLLSSLTFCLFLLGAVPVSAEVRVISSQGEFRMGNRDTREDAMRLATETAKRNALEQVATYLESVTVVEGTDVTRNEIKTYSAGLILVLDQQANLWLDGDVVVVTVDLTSQIDTEEVAQAILALRENESGRHQLTTLKTEIDELHRELEAANLSLAAAVTAEEAQQASVQRQDILNRVQSNAMISQVWTDWVIVAPVGYFASWGGMQPQGLLNAARSLYPASPHVEAAQQVVVMKPATAGRPPGTRSAPLTLNEISHTTSTVPVRLGTQPSGVRAMVPVPIVPRGLAPGQQTPSFSSRSVRSLQQFLQPPAGMTPPGQAPITRRLPPTMRPHAPSYLAPRGSYPLSPRGLGGQYRGGGGAGGRGGGGGHGGGRGR
jgi:uncharacterized membrane protein YgcG